MAGQPFGFPYDKALRGGWVTFRVGRSPFEALVGIHRVVGIVGTYGALLLGTCFGKGSIPLVSGRWDPGYFRKIYVFFLNHGQKNWYLLETQNRLPKTNETKPSFPFSIFHPPSWLWQVPLLFWVTLGFVLRCFFVNTQKVVKFSTPNPGWKQVC